VDEVELGIPGKTHSYQLLHKHLTLVETDPGSVSSPESDRAGEFIALSYIMGEYPSVKLLLCSLWCLFVSGLVKIKYHNIKGYSFILIQSKPFFKSQKCYRMERRFFILV